jgi:hypothetical protein
MSTEGGGSVQGVDDEPVAAGPHVAESVFLRIDERNGGPHHEVAFLLEIAADGYIPREVGLAADGTATYVTRPGGYGVWNDAQMEYPPVGTPEFAALWFDSIGGKLISRDEFEPAYAAADAVLPETIGGTPMWISNAVGLGRVLGCLSVVAVLVFALVHAGGWILTFL